ISFSGFNGIDFSKIIDAIMQQESQPLTILQQRQADDQSKDSAFVQLGGYVSGLQDSATDLSSAEAFSTVAASSSDPTVLTVSPGVATPTGHYSVEVTDLAKSQVTASVNGYAAASDVVADGGSISFTMGGTTTEAIEITAATTLNDLKNK